MTCAHGRDKLSEEKWLRRRNDRYLESVHKFPPEKRPRHGKEYHAEPEIRIIPLTNSPAAPGVKGSSHRASGRPAGRRSCSIRDREIAW